jgi:hypothetical protein
LSATGLPQVGHELDPVIPFQFTAEFRRQSYARRQDFLMTPMANLMGLSSDVLAPFQKGLSALSQSLRAETACRGA